MEIAEEIENGVVILRPSGRLDGISSPILERAIDAVLERDERSLLVDLEDVPYISSRGLRVFLVCAKKAAGRNSQLAVCALQQFVRDTFQATGFLDLLMVSACRADAVASLSGSGAQPR